MRCLLLPCVPCEACGVVSPMAAEMRLSRGNLLSAALPAVSVMCFLRPGVMLLEWPGPAWGRAGGMVAGETEAMAGAVRRDGVLRRCI